MRHNNKGKSFLIFFIAMTFLVNSTVYAFDPGCVAGGCEQDSQQQSATSLYETDDYECVCPPRNTLDTIIDVIGVLSIPFEIFSSKPYLYSGATSLERLVKQGCKCKSKVKSQQETENTNTVSTETEQSYSDIEKDKREEQ